VLAVDKPRGWMLVPVSWQKTARNLQAALNSSIAARDFWARSRGIQFLRYVHRLDADTSGVLLFAKSQGAIKTFSDLFESRRMEKTYLAVVAGEPKETEWACHLKLAPDPRRIGRTKVDSQGKPAETHFRVLQSLPETEVFGVRQPVGALKSGDVSPQSKAGVAKLTLVEARPVTGRTHQIRVHLAESGFPIVGDELYGKPLALDIGRARLPHRQAEQQLGVARLLGAASAGRVKSFPLGLRALRLAYADPFTRRRVDIRAPTEEFCREFGFNLL